MEEEFEVAFGAGETARLHADREKIQGFRCGLDRKDCALMEGGVVDDPAGADVFTAEFELGLDKDEEIGGARGAGEGGRQDFGDGDEGYIGDDERGGFGDIARLKVAGVAFDSDDAWVLLQLPVELVGVDVHSENASGSVLEEAIGEASVGGAEVEADFSGGIEGEILQCAFEFEAAAGDVFLEAAMDFDLRVVENRLAGFGDLSAVYEDFASENHGLGFFAG